MALENNLGIRAERFSPQVQALVVAQTRARTTRRTLIRRHTKNSSSDPPQNFLAGNDFV